ncbi:MAG: glycosyltransferase, partial [Chloroflexota bacterium]
MEEVTHMPARSALDPALADGAARTGRADILVGIPSFNNAATIAHVVRAVSEGLRMAFPDSRAVIVNADGGSSDGTPSRVLESADGVPAIAGAYRGLPGKGSAFRAIFEVAAQVGARACAVVASDLRSITPMWVDRLLRPIVEGRADYVTPLYARHKHDGTITNTIAYPLTRALYGLRVRQPIGGEFGFSGELARAFLVGEAL